MSPYFQHGFDGEPKEAVLSQVCQCGHERTNHVGYFAGCCVRSCMCTEFARPRAPAGEPDEVERSLHEAWSVIGRAKGELIALGVADVTPQGNARTLLDMIAVLAAGAAPDGRATSEIADLQASDIGLRVTFFRERKGLTQSALARIVGASQSAISQIESGDRNPSFGMLVQLADGCGISLARLVGDGQRAADLTAKNGGTRSGGEYVDFGATP